MDDNQKPFFQRKTTWAAALTILTAIVGAKTGQIDQSNAANMLTQGLLALCLRSAMEPK